MPGGVKLESLVGEGGLREEDPGVVRAGVAERGVAPDEPLEARGVLEFDQGVGKREADVRQVARVGVHKLLRRCQGGVVVSADEGALRGLGEPAPPRPHGDARREGASGLLEQLAKGVTVLLAGRPDEVRALHEKAQPLLVRRNVKPGAHAGGVVAGRVECERLVEHPPRPRPQRLHELLPNKGQAIVEKLGGK